MYFLILNNNSSNVFDAVNISNFSEFKSLVSIKFGLIFFILEIIIDALSALESLSVDGYDKNSFSSAVVKALYILNWSS